MTRIALGVRTHSGWGAVVAVALSSGRITVLERRRLELVVPGPDSIRQPYHEAEDRPLPQAREIVERVASVASRLATEGLREIVKALHGRGRVERCGLLLSSGRTLPELPSILASHALIHAAEGELFRDAVRSAAAACELSIAPAPEREVWNCAARALGISPQRVREKVTALGRDIGPPWRQDEKLATAAALAALGGGSRSPV